MLLQNILHFIFLHKICMLSVCWDFAQLALFQMIPRLTMLLTTCLRKTLTFRQRRRNPGWWRGRDLGTPTSVRDPDIRNSALEVFLYSFWYSSKWRLLFSLAISISITYKSFSWPTLMHDTFDIDILIFILLVFQGCK